VMLIQDGLVHVVGHRGYAERGLKDWIESIRWPLADISNLREVAASGQPKIIPEVREYPGWLKTPETTWIGSFVNAPILQDGEVIGFLNLDKGERGFYAPEHAQRLMAFANQAAVALKNAHLHNAVRRYAADLEQRVRVRTAELRESEARYRAIVEDQTELIMRFVDDWALTFVNQAFLRYFDTTADVMIGASFMPLLHKDDSERMALILSALSAQDPVVTLECRVIMPDGAVRWMQWTTRMIVDEQGQFVEFQSTGRDVTERHKAEDVLHKSLVREIHLSELKSRFVSLVSHEFRNPLAVILMNNDILQRYHDRLTPGQREDYQQGIRAHVQQMTELLEDLLLVSQSEAGRLEVKLEVVDLVPFTHRIVDEVWTTGGADRALLVTMPDDCVTRTDPKLFRLIVVNLVSNAAKYTREGGSVAVHLSCTPNQVVFSVQDDGIGIPEEDQLRLYETFHRGNNVGPRKGTGLGLALVKQCVEQFGGTIAFHSEENLGTTFTVILPRKDALPSSGIARTHNGDHPAR
jgi:PAS domain S-box-containing protein